MGWAEVIKPVTVTGPVSASAERQRCERGATVAANLATGGLLLERQGHLGTEPDGFPHFAR
jgi:hypothetical protein